MNFLGKLIKGAGVILGTPFPNAGTACMLLDDRNGKGEVRNPKLWHSYQSSVRPLPDLSHH